MRRSIDGDKSTTTSINSIAAGLFLSGTRFRFGCQLLMGLALLFGGLVQDSRAAAKFVDGLVPDWNQPYNYASPSGPGPDPVPNAPNQWNDWCVPTSAANLAGYWTDYHGIPVADTTAYSGSTVAWGAGPSWQDYLADSNRAPQQVFTGSLPSPVTDIGWYLDTNRGVNYDDGSGYLMAASTSAISTTMEPT
jgi:hypothetical protein